MSRMGRLSVLVLAAILGACSAGDEPGPEEPAEGDPGDEVAILRDRMVDIIESDAPGIDARVLTALRKVPRHRFVPGASVDRAYDADAPLPIGEGQYISTPLIVAQMTSSLELAGGEKVLEIGTGSGYQAAVLAELAPEVHTIEILPALASRARERLRDLGYDNVTVHTGNGYRGLPDHAPFDAILVTAAPPETPPDLLAQLAVGGRLIVPEGEGRTQWLMIHRKVAEDRFEKEKSIPVIFDRMVRDGD